MTKQTQRKIKTYLRQRLISDGLWFRLHTKFRQSYRLIPEGNGGPTLWIEDFNNYS